MKFFKYIMIAMASLVALTSCEKHGLGYDCENIDTSEKALVVIWRLIPEASTTGARVYTITIDDQPLWGNNYTYLDARAFRPNQSRHYILEPGDHNMKWYLLDGTCVYDQNFTAIKGMQEVVVSNYNAAPTVVDNNAAYPQDKSEFTQDSYHIRFANFMYEDENYTIPTYKLQYYYQDPTDLEWYPASDPVGFGEVSPWTRVHIDQYAENRNGSAQSGAGSSYGWADNRVEHPVTNGSCRIYYKIKRIEEDGTESWMTYNRKNGAEASETEYKDYWTGYVGRHEFHFFRGMRVTNGGTTSNTACWITQGAKY